MNALYWNALYMNKIVIFGISCLMVISVIIFFTVKSYINLNIQQSNKIVYHANTSIKNTLMQKFWFFRNEREKTHINKSNAEK